MSITEYLESFRLGLSAEAYWLPWLSGALLAAGGCRIIALLVRPKP